MLTSSVRNDSNIVNGIDAKMNPPPGSSDIPYHYSGYSQHHPLPSGTTPSQAPPNHAYGYQGAPHHPYFHPQGLTPHSVPTMANQPRPGVGVYREGNSQFPSVVPPQSQDGHQHSYPMPRDQRQVNFHSSTHNTNNNHMIPPPVHGQFGSPRVNYSTPPVPPQLQGHPAPLPRNNANWQNTANQLGSGFPPGKIEKPQQQENAEETTPNTNAENAATPNKRAYPCPKCQKVFKRGDHLKRHLLSVHDREHPYQCGECSKGFASVHTLTRHVQAAHSDVTNKGLVCMRCNIRLPSISDLESHSNALHQSEDVEYMKNINKSSKTFQCEMCLKTVSSEKNLKRHIKKLHGENARNILSCSVCEQSFISSVNLKEHMQRAHATQLPQPPTSQLNMPVKQEPAPPSFAMQNMHKNLHQFSVPTSYLNQKAMNESPKPERKPMMPAPAPSHPVYEKTPFIPAKQVVSAPQIYAKDQGPTAPVNGSMSSPFAIDDQYMETNLSQQQVYDKPPRKHPNSENMLWSTAKETNSVSEVFSIAMKTLSDFAYDDLSLSCGDYIPASLSSFHSNSALPNFHYPASVPAEQAPAPTPTISTPQPSICVAGPAVPFSSVSSNADQQETVHAEQSIELSANMEQTEAALVRKGRPKKKKQGSGSDSDDLPDNGMIVKQESQNNGDSFTCTVCQQVYTGIDNLMQHVESIHLSVNPHECCICNKRFAQAGNVKRHIRFVHLRERPFQCRDCSSTFDRLCYLQRHMRSHVDSKVQSSDSAHLNPCNCPECGKRCLTAHHLRGHMQRKHFAKNKQQSEKLMEKYAYLFNNAGPIGREFDQYGRPVDSKQQGKKKQSNLDNGPQHPANSFPNHHNMHPGLPTSNAFEYGHVTGVPTLHENSINGGYACFVDNSSVNLAMKPISHNPADEIGRLEKPKDGSQLEKLLIDSGSTKNSNRWRGKRSRKMQTQKSLQRKSIDKKSSYKLYNSNCNFQNQKLKLLNYKCQHCPGRKFSSLALLKSHIAVVHHNTTRRHLCLLCGHSFSSNILLMAHVSKRHSSAKNLKRLPARKGVDRMPAKPTFVLHQTQAIQESSFQPNPGPIVNQINSSLLPVDTTQSYQQNKLYDPVDHIPSQPLVPTQ